MRPGAIALALSLAVPAAASAQGPPLPADDPIAAILADPAAYSTDEAEEEEAAPVATQPELRGPQPAPAPAYTPQPYRPPPRPSIERPVNIDEKGRTPEGPPRPQDLGYDMRIRAGIANAQGKQGPLDGGWRVSAANDEGLYTFQLVDPGDAGRPLEGAWRNLQRQGLGTTGLISSLDHGTGELTVRFLRQGASSPTVLTLKPQADGGWIGEMLEGGRRQPVTMRRN